MMRPRLEKQLLRAQADIADLEGKRDYLGVSGAGLQIGIPNATD